MPQSFSEGDIGQTRGCLAAISRPSENPPGEIPGKGPLPPYRLPVHKNKLNPFRILVGILKCSLVNHGSRVEHDDVGIKTGFEYSPFPQSDALRGERGHFADC